MSEYLILKSKINLVGKMFIVCFISAICLIIAQEELTMSSILAVIMFLIAILRILMPNKMIFNQVGKGTVDSKIWMFLFFRIIHREDLKKVKSIIHRILETSETDILLFEDGFEMIIPNGDNCPDKIVQWFKEVYGITLPIIIKDYYAKILPPIKEDNER